MDADIKVQASETPELLMCLSFKPEAGQDRALRTSTTNLISFSDAPQY